MTGTLIDQSAMKDILTGIFLSMLIIIVMHAVPAIGIVAWVIIPLPVLFYRLKIGRPGSLIIMAVCLIALLSFSRNIAFNAFYFGSLLMTGLLLGECIERHLSIDKIMGYTCTGLTGAFCLFLLIYAFTQSQSIGQLINGFIAQYQAVSSALFAESAQLYPDVKLDKDMFEKASHLFMITFPGIMLSTYLTMALINILLIKKLLKKNNITVQSLENLNRWRASDKIVLVLIAVGGMFFLPLGAFKIVLLNCLIILLLIYFYQGMAIVSFYFEKKRVPFIIKAFVYFLIAVQPLFLMLVVSFGLFDTWINFRRLDIPIEKN